MLNLNLVHLVLDILQCGDAEVAALLNCEIFLEIFQCLLEYGIGLHVGICVFPGVNTHNQNPMNVPHLQSVKPGLS